MSSSLPFHSDGQFRVWEFWVSHSMLLIRSAHSDEPSQNVDLVFHGVNFMSIPSLFRGLTVTEGDPEAQATFDRRFPGQVDLTRPGHTLFVLQDAAGATAYVAAATCRVDHNDRDPMARRLDPLE